ncbi:MULTISPECIES: hypothetical protein [Chryseobacterium]|uniref:Uncharacterized protein n=1 Tax=Chryseobacterium camelliae TaxID=1265445 RepID=A0ABU0TMY1_9FLAO|nr:MULTISPECIES: hypothetical protein [Chryseobacterium]MDT3407734.1 hypothetical protein [Pseudacidovorax intermedius]MDQ1098415.1 hypothetical protein [Chryseobacterium camelliae]MDQ1102339.1 hypothetical protein [Chryseobacterium sp. SORGH_AS_1048]MDR6085775.1 hypothetical protein [Chryseobacterium sp. SORGH_AS_0909]MDR6130140.1 hypothetical protein [Chryseobacterium sp. SORGH_AS_1175]
MPTLNEYLGGIVSEIASARKMADLQTIQIAREYAKDELLKNFSVPRMKIGTVDLTIPFARAGSLPILQLRDFAYDEITKVFKTNYDPSDREADLQLKKSLIDLESEYDEIIDTLSQEIKTVNPRYAKYFGNIANRIVEICESLPNIYWKETNIETLRESMLNRTIYEAKKIIEKTPDNDVIVEASKLMELDAKCLIYAKMSISESGMEWSRYEDIDGNIVETLIPE